MKINSVGFFAFGIGLLIAGSLGGAINIGNLAFGFELFNLTERSVIAGIVSFACILVGAALIEWSITRESD